eukprot:3926660-Karenia_brevis.AAC.1
MPSMKDRQVLSAQDPLATAHQFQIMMRVVVPALFGIRMCFACPLCNCDDADLDFKPSTVQSCSNCFGCTQKLMGGYAGLATAL